MSRKSNKKQQASKGPKVFKWFLLISLAVLLPLIALSLFTKLRANWQQSKLKSFYETAGLNPNGTPGEIVRQEELATAPANGKGWRILYRTQKHDGTPTFSSGLVFVPNNTNAEAPRPVVAWAHGTIGMGDACAPSRTAAPPATIPGLSGMLERGWVVTATDYAGLGTPGIEGYLVGGDEARDVLNSVRAARNLPASQAGSTYGLWGHSQGGHSALFTSQLGTSYAPELKLVGTVASAPAAELGPLLKEQHNTALGWVIGPEVILAWPQVYDNLNPSGVMTTAGQRNYKKIAEQCIKSSALEGIVRNKFGQQFFKLNPLTQPGWQVAAAEQTAPTLQPDQPLMIAESTADQVVLPNTTALYIQKACQAGSNLSSLWLAQVGHVALAPVIAPSVSGWLDDRFNGRPNPSSCTQPLPVTPINE